MQNPLIKHGIAIVRICLGAVFLYAGMLKIVDTTAFAGSIAAYRLFPYFFNFLVAAILPWLEVICGVVLVTGWRTRPAAFLILLLNLFFTAALLSALVRGLEIDCGCFRPGAADPPLMAIGRDLIFMAMAGLVIWQDWRRSTT